MSVAEKPSLREVIIDVAIIGSREFKDYEYMKERIGLVLTSIWERMAKQGVRPFFRIISGGAGGADTFAKKFALAHNMVFAEFLPDFKQYGTPYRKQDYYNRDVEIAEACKVLIGFLVKVEGENRGSKLTIKAALDLWKEVHVFYK